MVEGLWCGGRPCGLPSAGRGDPLPLVQFSHIVPERTTPLVLLNWWNRKARVPRTRLIATNKNNAQQAIVTLMDGIDGSEAVVTVRYGLDGHVYEIDRNEAHAEDLREVFAPYVVAARSAGRPVGCGRPLLPSRARQPTPGCQAVRASATERALRSTRAAGSRPRSLSSTEPPDTDQNHRRQQSL